MKHFSLPCMSLLWAVFAVCAFTSANVWSQSTKDTPVPAAPAAAPAVPAGDTPTAAVPAVDTASAAVVPPAASDSENTKDASQTRKESQSFGELAETCWDLLKRGGFLMWPIGVISVMVVGVGLERMFSLCRCFCLPSRLFVEVDNLVASDANPRNIFKVVEQTPCAASNVIKALLYKTGRPMLEVQAEYESAKNGEANRLFRPVRFLVLAASVTPLIGLLGTVIGMIQAFIEVSNLSSDTLVGANRADLLAQGIYVALVTTCAGLIVAIPAAILAHWYEGRILRLFQNLDNRLVNFMSWMESKEGKVRVTPELFSGNSGGFSRPVSKSVKK